MAIRHAAIHSCGGICKICAEDAGCACQTESVRQWLAALKQSRELE